MLIEQSERIAILKKIHLFYGLEDDDLAAVAEEMDEKTCLKDEIIFQQDTIAEGFYIIHKGKVRVVRKQDGREMQLAVLVKNDYFGELALVSNRRRSATVTAVEDTSVFILSRADFEKLFKKHNDLAYNLEVAVRSRQLARKLRFKWLRPDEVIYFLARKHWIAMYPKILLPIALLILPILLGYAYFNILSRTIVAIAASGSFIGLAAWIGWLILDWSNDYYVVTNQRVVWLEKVIGIYDSRQESPLSMIVSVGTEVNQFGRFLDYGNVIVRTYVGRIDFSIVNHPKQAAKMVEEYWERTRDAAKVLAKEEMKDAIRSRLGIPITSKTQPSTADAQNGGQTQGKPGSDQPTSSTSRQNGSWWMKLLGANTLKLRYETGDSVIYRKHWVVLIIDSWIPVLGFLVSSGLFVTRLIQLMFSPEEVFISLATGLVIDVWALMYMGAMAPFFLWIVYQIMDWSNDTFQVTADQIIDIDRKPLGTESRNSAQLENILGTKYERRGLLGNLFNFGHVYITVGGNKMTFEDVRDPASVQSDIDRRRDARIVKKNQATSNAERDRLADLIATYHENADTFRDELNNKRKP